MFDLIGKTVGPYRILEQAGAGGMATVYKAYQPNMDRYIAVKVLPMYLSKDPEFTKRFQREARAIARLEHAHILPVYDYGEYEGITYLAMRYIKAGTLKDRMSAGRLSLDEINNLISQIGSALDYAHRMGVIHRDIKPGNVLMDEQGDVYLSDFGLARMMEPSQKLTGSGVGLGTPAYMSPEQGQGNKIDHRTDIYALGIILYEMLTGRVPYEAETPMAVVLKHIQGDLPLPHNINPNTPEPVEKVILKALAKDPADRYQTAGEMIQALNFAVRTMTAEAQQQTIAEEVAPAQQDVSLVTKIQRLWDQPRGKVALVAGALAVLSILGLLLSQLSGQVAIVGPETSITATLAITQQLQVASPTTERFTATELPTTSFSPQGEQTCVPPPAGLVAWYPGDGDADDIIGGNDGALTGGTSFNVGMVGQAFRFDGINASLNVPNKNDVFDVGEQLTIDLWMKADPDNSMAGCCQGLVTTDFYELVMAGRGQTGLTLTIGDAATGLLEHATDSNNGIGSPLLPDIWYHIAGVYDGAQIRTYVNGVLMDAHTKSAPGPIKPMLDGTEFGDSFLAIGSEDGRHNEHFRTLNRYFKGLIDEVEIYNRALSQTEIQALFAAGSAGKCKSIISDLPASTLTPQVTQADAFAEPILQAIANRPPDFEDDFSANRGWQLFEPWDAIDGGVLKINVPEGETYGSAWHSQMLASDFVFQVDVRADVLERFPERVSKADILLRERASVGDSYSLSLYPQLAKWEIYDHVDGTQLATGSLPDLVSMGQWIKIVVVARGNQFAVFINDQPIAYFVDDTIADGRNKLGASGGGGRADVKFDNVKFWNLENVPGLP